MDRCTPMWNNPSTMNYEPSTGYWFMVDSSWFVMKTASQATGQLGEDTATAYIRSLGYCIRERNTHLGHDEVDIIAFDPAERALVFVEVKTLGRRREPDQHPSAGFTGIKKRRTLRAARKWISEHEYEKGYRIDLICVIGQRVVEHLREVNFEY